ncbi:F-box only protein 36-like [Onthophagus taurus]|uniref:F-box only protein 36-like n=1 Tax=Onthophagus taurus TaxID=166361 RepID=UPI000C201D11|nr:F-box only protein 36-like [Onthophagus taurus]
MTVSDENEVQLQLYARAPSPSRDYYGLTITQSKIILNIWNVSYGPHVYPKRHISSLEDFVDERYMQHDIQRTFGDYALSFVKSFAAKERRLECLPMKIFLKIARFLATNDILHLSQTSKIFFDICNSEGIWRILYKKKIKRRVMLSDIERGTEIGWKQALKTKIYTKATLRNLLEKNETRKLTSNNLTSNTTPNVLLGNPTDSKYDNHNISKNVKRIEEVNKKNDTKRFTKSVGNLKKNSLSKIESIDPSKPLIRSKNDETLQSEISYPINKSKLKNVKKEFDGLMGKSTIKVKNAVKNPGGNLKK